MDLFFNELSVSGLSSDAIADGVTLFALVVKEARQQGFGGVRFETDMRSVMLTERMSFAQYCDSCKDKQEIKALLSFQIYPYFDEAHEDDYLKAKDFKVRIDGDTTLSAYGLAAAYVNKSCGVGFASHRWSGFEYEIHIEQEDEDTVDKVYCLSSLPHFDDPLFVKWADLNLPEPPLVRSKSIPLDKRIHLSHHHGEDTLYAFAKKIRKSPYVEEVVNSIDIVPGEKRFISSFHDGNMIDIRLVKEGGFGLTIRTTARNQRQLHAIAKHLEQDYY